MAADLIHKVLNMVFPLVIILGLLLCLPPVLVYKLVSFLYRSKSIENLAAKVVLITGASSGIGEIHTYSPHLAYKYGRRGDRLALAARRVDRLCDVADKAQRLGSPEAIVLPADVSKLEDCNRLVDDTVNHFGQLDHLVNNAGIVKTGLFEDCTQLSDFSSIMDINFWGSVYCTKFAVPHLRKSIGKIVVISSSATWFSAPVLSLQARQRRSFFETLRAEVGSDIGITIVSPGVIKSEMSPHFESNIPVMPSQSTEACVEAIVDSVSRGDAHLTQPSWIHFGFWARACYPEILEAAYHVMANTKIAFTTSTKHA